MRFRDGVHQYIVCKDWAAQLPRVTPVAPLASAVGAPRVAFDAAATRPAGDDLLRRVFDVSAHTHLCNLFGMQVGEASWQRSGRAPVMRLCGRKQRHVQTVFFSYAGNTPHETFAVPYKRRLLQWRFIPSANYAQSATHLSLVARHAGPAHSPFVARRARDTAPRRVRMLFARPARVRLPAPRAFRVRQQLVLFFCRLPSVNMASPSGQPV